MAMSVSPGRAGGIGHSQRGCARQFCFTLLRSLGPVRGGGGSIASNSSFSAAILCGGNGGNGGGIEWKEKRWGRRSSAAAVVVAMADDGKGLRHPPRGIASAVAATGGAAASPPGTGRDPLPPEAKTFSASISTDLPLYDTPEASFDEYLDDRPRIFRAMFPDRRRSRQLNEEEWKVQMLPIEFLFASVNPVVVMRLRCCSHGEDHPLEVPPHITRALDLRVTRWELRGLDMAHSPRHFGLDVRGLLYPDRGEGSAAAAAGRRSRLRGRLQMSISFVLPPVLSLVPEQVLRGVADSVLRRLLQKMKDNVNGGLLSDFQSFRRERMKEKQLLKKPALRQLLRPDPDQTP